MKTIQLGAAKEMAGRAAAHARVKGWKISIAVVGAEGQLVYFERGDESTAGSALAAVDKAKASLLYRRPTQAFAELLKQGRLDILTLPSVCAVAGGVPVTSGEEFVGAIGVSGAKPPEDEECALAGLGAP